MAEIKRTAETINVGVADMIYYPYESDIPVYLGLTQGGVKVIYETEYHEVKSDQTGNTPLDDVLLGEKVTVEANLLDTSLEKLISVLPTAKGINVNNSLKATTFGQSPGKRMIDCMGKLVIHPIAAGSGNASRDITIYQTVNTGGLQLEFINDKEWIIPVKFKGYYDDRRSEGDKLFRIGEDTPDVVTSKRIVRFWITPSNPAIEVGENTIFKANAMYDDNTTEDATSKAEWNSTQLDIVKLEKGSNGCTATGLLEGVSVVRATLAGYTSSTTITVK